ncbi:MAG: carboxypeptidase regulatory-like domain-containing protein [Planctomycetes bacterium]|nr:carboxypeptidase regulatory-like domain-containing protein [Planctomycetota bacterium]
MKRRANAWVNWRLYLRHVSHLCLAVAATCCVCSAQLESRAESAGRSSVDASLDFHAPSVRGRVELVEGGAPASATVRLLRECDGVAREVGRASSGADGSFAFEPDSACILERRERWCIAIESAGRSPKLILWPQATRIDLGRVALERSSKLSVFVSHSDGEPASSAQVTARLAAAPAGAMEFSMAADARGVARFDDLGAGEWVVAAVDRERTRFEVSFPLRLRPDRETKHGVRLPDSPSPRLRWKGPALDGARPLAVFGRVQLPLRQPGGIEVESLHWSAPRIPGESQWLLPNATDQARVFRSGFSPRSIAIGAGASLTEFDAAMGVECSVELDSGGAEIASVSAWRHGLPLCVPSGFEVDRFHPRVSVLAPSKWRVQLDEAREWGFEVHLAGGGTHTGRASTRLGGLERVELHGRASDALATLSGRVVDTNGVPLAGARVLLSAQRRWTSTDASGAFTFPSLEFGSHTVTAWRDRVRDERPLVARQDIVLARFADPVLLTLGPTEGFDVRVQLLRDPAPAGTELLCFPLEGYGDSACVSPLTPYAFRFSPIFGNRFAFVPIVRSNDVLFDASRFAAAAREGLWPFVASSVPGGRELVLNWYR